MSESIKQPTQQYELKLGVIHHTALKTVQLIEFLQNQINEFLQNDLPQYIKGDQKFINVLQSFMTDEKQLSQYEFQEYVGLILIYSTSSDESYQYFLQNIESILRLDIGELFIVAVQMDNSDKQANVVGNSGEKFCLRNNIQFVRLSLYNSEDLISLINKNIYQLIENYYYPNEQILPIEPMQQNTQPKSEKVKSLTNRSKKQNNQDTENKNSQYIFSYDQNSQIIKAYDQGFSSNQQKAQEILNHAVELRKTRQKQILIQQQQLDESIENIENVLNNINHRIKQKLQSAGWFSQLKQKLYMTPQKENQNFSKIKLTQQFIDDQPKKYRKNFSFSNVQSRNTGTFSQSLKNFTKNFNTLKFNTNNFRTSILKFILFFSKEKVVQLDVYDNSNFEQLAIIALKKLDIRQTDKNIEKMIQKIRRTVQNFIKEFQKAIKANEQRSKSIYMSRNSIKIISQSKNIRPIVKVLNGSLISQKWQMLYEQNVKDIKNQYKYPQC